LQIGRVRYVIGMSTVVVILIVIAVIALIALAFTAGKRKRHAQLRETVGAHHEEAQARAARANELEAAAAEERERERHHAQVAADAEQRLPER
jgi:FtsZ-interacting cell division protein ZipA